MVETVPGEKESHLDSPPRATTHSDRFDVRIADCPPRVAVSVVTLVAEGQDQSKPIGSVDEGHEMKEAAVGHGLLELRK